jgi:hypothetical protein
MDDVDRRIEERLVAELDFRVARREAIEPGQPHNNRVWQVWSTDSREVVVKVFFRDQGRRLDREYAAITFLRSRGIQSVPTPFLGDECVFAVYSFVRPDAFRTGPYASGC